MKIKQSLITDFFKVKSQSLITDYFKPKAQHVNAHSTRHQYFSRENYKHARFFLKKHRNFYDVIKTQQGYCYCASNNFTEYRVLTTRDRFINIKHKKIFLPAGTRVATAMIDNDSALEHIHVEIAFRRQGIGKNLIRFMNKRAPQFHIYGGVE